MLDLSQRQLLELWSELMNAYHGKSGFGGDTAEIYAYELQPDDPAARAVMPEIVRGLAQDARARQTASSLVQVLNLFCDMQDCTVEVEGLPLAEWPPADYCFDWRVRVTVKNR